MQNTYIAHSRTKGSKNGVRLYQNKDGSLTPLGREHYGIGPPRSKVKTTLSKWASKRKEKAEKKAEESKPLDLKSMSNDDLRKMIERAKLENDLKNLMAKPKKPSVLKEFADVGKAVVKDSLKDAMTTKLTEFIKNHLGTPDASAMRSSKEYKYWKEHDFKADYAPGSVKNPFSKAAVEESNRVAKVKAQKADRTLDTSKADSQYWKKQNEREDRDAAKKTRTYLAEYELAKAKLEAAREDLDKAQSGASKYGVGQAKADFARADAAAQIAKKKFDDSYADLTYEQRNLVRSNYEDDIAKKKK